ncbi:acetoacetate--CoA ligase [Frankia sp. Mgl5]|uniref:acetoacetate--CoA ligase n=1 Tax=Frankia sp. Mgl5 TaxID=2933793 RepID=UPI00200DE1DD|nr:acetoacetate--CoA ligase [Frankia sp. Mgl5]MCK9932623.1 acetoacetate--CoA ligase [Frankia sp. Mgl5]
MLWEPPPRRVTEASVTRYREWLADEHQLRIADSTRLRLWAEAEPGRFWDSIWEFCAVEGDRGDGPALTGAAVPDARWFPTARVNYAENALTRHGPAPAIIAVREDGATAVVSWDELRRQVARAAAGLRRLGVRPGDRVGAVLPNTVHAVVAMLATASVGAVWASCSPDLEPAALAERFIQITPRVLIGVDGYTRGGQGYDAIPPLADLARRLPNLAATVLVPYLSADAYPRAASADLPGLLTWDDLLAAEAEPAFTRLPFDAPLWILFTDEIAGPPRPVVHGHGGILLEHLKSLVLHLDLGPDDRFCWYGTTSGMMWNYQVSGLLTGATIVLYDGSPSHPDVSILWRLAEAVDVTCLGVSVALVEACRRVGLVPGRVADLSLLRTVGAFGAPFIPEAGAWVYDTVSPSVAFVAMSGGTEVCTALVTGLPTDPVRAGEAGRALGCAVAVVDPSGREVPGGGVGELVVTAPMPSAPLFVWGDPTGSWLLQKHLARFPGWWWQGERARMTQAGGIAVDGPLDALAAPTGARTAGARTTGA